MKEIRSRFPRRKYGLAKNTVILFLLLLTLRNRTGKSKMKKKELFPWTGRSNQYCGLIQSDSNFGFDRASPEVARDRARAPRRVCRPNGESRRKTPLRENLRQSDRDLPGNGPLTILDQFAFFRARYCRDWRGPARDYFEMITRLFFRDLVTIFRDGFKTYVLDTARKWIVFWL